MIDSAEQFLKQLLGENELRVRLEPQNLARIEVPVSTLPKLIVSDVCNRVVERFLELGFANVTIDLQGFRSGSMNAMLGDAQLIEINEFS